jgi:hypothetical protein
LRRKKFNNNGATKYVEFWRLGMPRNDIYAKTMGPYVKYWENILATL